MSADFTAFSFTFMKCCFKNFIIMCLLLSLLFMRSREMQLMSIFVKKMKYFLLMFKINFSLNVNRVDVLCKVLITEALKKTAFIFAFISLWELIQLWILIQFWELILLWIKQKLKTILNCEMFNADMKIRNCMQTLKFETLQWIYLMLCIICTCIISF